jgi:hypothetical protein
VAGEPGGWGSPVRERGIHRLKNAGLIILGSVHGIVLTVTVGLEAWWLLQDVDDFGEGSVAIGHLSEV